MGSNEMQIFLDNGPATYSPGDKVSGRVVLNLTASKRVIQLKLKIKGGAFVHWTERETRKNSEGKSETYTVSYSSREKYFNIKHVLAGEGEMGSGSHSFPFSAFLPGNLPTSYESSIGRIRYFIETKLVLPGLLAKSHSQRKVAFTVISPVDLNRIEGAQRPLQLQREKMVGDCCCQSGPLSASVSAPYSGFTSGQVIPVTIHIDNSTKTKVVGGSVHFHKVATYTAQGRRKIIKTEIVRQLFMHFPLLTRDSKTYQMDVRLPALPPTNTNACKIIDIAYYLKVKLPVEGMCMGGLNLTTPVTLGTVPLINPNSSAAIYPSSAFTSQPTSSQMAWAGTADYQTYYSQLPPPSYEECLFGPSDPPPDYEGAKGFDNNWRPLYPTYDYAPSAPPAPQ